MSESFSLQPPDRAAELRAEAPAPAVDEQAARLFERIASQSAAGQHGQVYFQWRLAAATAAVDLFAVVFGFGAAVLIADGIRDLIGIQQVAPGPFLAQRVHELVLLSALAIGIFAFGGLYRRGGWELEEVKRIFAGVGLLALFDATLQFAMRDHASRLWFLAAYPMVAVSVISFRTAFRAMPPVREALTSHIVLLGSGIASELLLFELRESRANPIRLLRRVPLSKIEGRDLQKLDQMLDRLAALAGIPAHRMQIVLAPAPEEIAGTQELLSLLNALRRPYSIILPFGGLARNGLRLHKVIGADMVMAEVRPPHARRITCAVKSLMDFVVAATLLVVLAPVFAILSALLLLEGGPVFFTQTRIGRDGRRFRCIKFRTMRADAEAVLNELLENDPAARAEWAQYQKLRNDPRITPLGHFLRKTSLDELPQLFNVLLGEMSLVGPRPIVAPEVAGYPNDRAYHDSPEFAYYLSCTPGLTGLWQVSGRSATRHRERIRLDRWYARNHSIWLDIVILLKTIRVVLFRVGST